jgi:hypothetical protein
MVDTEWLKDRMQTALTVAHVPEDKQNTVVKELNMLACLFIDAAMEARQNG